ncbi:phage major tail tube protein [Paenibacillus pabuli]|uniref:phage major tail tube protein n=1 Tax=Paenibacillus pabuli TaxID=1472 RepID=UPI0020001EDF|nr:phage major tail tube protein [Paenibacillus pabuli]UPK45892.1 phage major tail tube protein [Paenibacillus pabuli]
MAQIPLKTIDFAVFEEGKNDRLATANIDLPGFETLTTEVSGAGIMGLIEVPSPGHFASQTLTINWNSIVRQSFNMMKAGLIALEFRSAQQVFDNTNSAVLEQGIKITYRGLAKNNALGTLAKNEGTGGTTEIEMTYIKIWMDGNPVLEVDKPNYIFRINGEDQNSNLKKILGY